MPYLQGASLAHANLQNSLLLSTYIQGTNFSNAQLEGARISASKTDRDTCFQGIFIQKTDESYSGGYCRTDFSGTQWQEENFIRSHFFFRSEEEKMETEVRTRDVMAWFTTNFPTEYRADNQAGFKNQAA